MAESDLVAEKGMEEVTTATSVVDVENKELQKNLKLLIGLRIRSKNLV